MATGSNFEIALKAEQKRCTKNFQAYTSEQRANHAASHRLGYQQRRATGEVFWTHPDFPSTAFPSRIAAARAALSNAEAA
jgi:hypothetical protein